MEITVGGVVFYVAIDPFGMVWIYIGTNKCVPYRIDKKEIMQKTYSSLRVLVNTPIYGGSYTTAQYVYNGLKSLGVTVQMTDNSIAESLLKRLLQNQIIDRNTNYLTAILSDLIWQDISIFKPHIVFMVAQSPFSDQLMKSIKDSGIVSIYWFVEDFRRFGYWRDIAHYFDYFYMIQRGHQKLDILPLAADPLTHKRIELANHEKTFYGSDISFMGAAYPNRINFFKHFDKTDLKLWGTGWYESELSNFNIPLKSQRITPQQSNMIYQSSKININLHSSNSLENDKIGDFVNPRTFEIAACGGFQMVDDRPAVREFFESDKEIVYFTSVEDALEKSKYYLANENLRHKIAIASQERTLKFHTYALRLSSIFDKIFQPKQNSSSMSKQEALEMLLNTFITSK